MFKLLKMNIFEGGKDAKEPQRCVSWSGDTKSLDWGSSRYEYCSKWTHVKAIGYVQIQLIETGTSEESSGEPTKNGAIE